MLCYYNDPPVFYTMHWNLLRSTKSTKSNDNRYKINKILYLTCLTIVL